MAELIWDGKYDKDGKKAAPLRVALPFQTVETINESAQERQRVLDLFSSGRDPEWRNRLIWGDKKYVLPALLDEFAGKIDLIYIDPPFDTGQNFSFQVHVNGESFTKEPSIIEQKAYRDTWAGGVDSYLQWFYETVLLLKELLARQGTLWVHQDWHVGYYVRGILDEVFGSDRFKNEVVWHYTNKLGTGWSQTTFDSRHDSLFAYTAGDVWVHNEVREPVKNRKPQPVTQKVAGVRKWLRDEAGRRVYELGAEDRPLGDVWEIPIVNPMADERVGYATQKPETLLERIVSASSNEGDLVFDCFVGSGTAAVVAEKLNRRWIACDLSRFAVHTARKRLLDLPNRGFKLRPFVVQNLGKYERQLWQAAEFGEGAETKQAAYRRFILQLYRASAMTGYNWLHGVKGGRIVHVGAVDSPVSPGDVTQIAAEFKKAVGTGKDAPQSKGIDILGWDFAFELNEVTKQQAAQAGLDVRFLRIPRDVMDKKAVDQGDVRFFELAALSVDVQCHARTVTVKLTDFVIPPDDVPEDVQRAITHWEQWIDYWAIDWDFRGDTFHNQWQDYRTRKKRDIEKSAKHTYEQPGDYAIVIKVMDILGNDTTRTVPVKVH